MILTKIFIWLAGTCICNVLFDLMLIVYSSKVAPTWYGLLLASFKAWKYPMPEHQRFYHAWFSVILSWFGAGIGVIVLVIIKIILGRRRSKLHAGASGDGTVQQ